MVGIVATNATSDAVLLTGVAGLVAGAMSMAAGEYVSVHSQADAESADLQREKKELSADPEAEVRELAAIYVGRGVPALLAAQVAEALMTHDALGAHARDELGIHDSNSANPVQAALASAASFAVGALVPLLTALLWSGRGQGIAIAAISLVSLAILGGTAAQVGGAGVARGALRVVAWGAFAMAVTASVGSLFGAVV